MLSDKLQRLLDGKIAVHVSDEETFDKLMKFFDEHEILWCDGDVATQCQYEDKLQDRIALFPSDFKSKSMEIAFHCTTDDDLLTEELTMSDFATPLDTSVYDASLLLPGDIIITDDECVYEVIRDKYIVNIEDPGDYTGIDSVHNSSDEGYYHVTSVVRPDNLTLYLQNKPTPVATIFQSTPTPKLVDTSEIQQEIKDTLEHLKDLQSKLEEVQR